MALPPQQFCVRWNSYHTNLQTVFPRLLVSEQFADVTLACEARALRCHKLVLSACSGYLERLLLQNPCKHPIVFMKDMRFSELQALVDFMYKGEVNVTQDELPSLLKSAEALQIRGLCSSEAGPLPELAKSSPKDYAVATEALLAQAQRTDAGVTAPAPRGPAPAKRRADVKEETVEEDGLFYGELDHDNMDYNEDEESGKPGSSLGQASGSSYLRVKPESELFFQNKLQSLAKNSAECIARLNNLTSNELQREFSKYGLTTDAAKSENDFYKSWLEQNGELEVSLLKAGEKKPKPIRGGDEVELIPKSKTSQPVFAGSPTVFTGSQPVFTGSPPVRRRGRPPIYKDRSLDVCEPVLKADLEQFLEGKEVSSSGLSRAALERAMMGKFNPNRRYSNEAMWAALMDVKKGGSIYRAAQTHKVPRKSLRNWMKRCHIKSSFPMPQQLKQFVENSRRRREASPEHEHEHDHEHGIEHEQETGSEFGKHFLSRASSEDDVDKAPVDMSVHDGGE